LKPYLANSFIIRVWRCRGAVEVLSRCRDSANKGDCAGVEWVQRRCRGVQRVQSTCKAV